MPVDANIPLGVRPVDVPDPLETRARYAQLASLAGSQQLQQQQLQTGNLELQQRKQDIQDQQTLRQAFMDSNGDGDKFLDIATQRGVSPKTLLALKGSLLDMKTKTATLDKDTLANTQTQHDQLQSRLAPILDEKDPVKQEALWNAALPAAVQAGEMKPEEAAQHPYPGSDGVKNYAKSLNLSKWALSQQQGATALQRTAEAAATASKQTQTDFQNASAKLGATKSPDEFGTVLGTLPYALAKQFEGKSPDQARAMGLSAEQQTTAAQATATAAEIAKRDAANEVHQTNGEAIARAHLDIARQEFAFRKNQAATAADPYGSLTPAMQGVADKVANGDIGITDLGRFPPATKQALLAAAVQKNPAWTTSTALTKKSFLDADKPESKNLQTIGRIVGHLGDFEKNSSDLGISPGLGLGLQLTGGQKKVHEDAHAIAAEFEKLTSGGVGAASQTQDWIKSLTSADTSVRQKAVDELSQLAGAQFTSMNQAYKAAVGGDLPLEKFTTPATRQWIAKKKIDVLGNGAPQAAAPGGAPASYSQTATGPGGHKIGSSDGGITWVDIQTGKKVQ
jgi:hypothetical protein